MARIRFSLSMLSLAFVASVATADDIKGKVTALDLNKRTITVNVGDKDQSFDVAQAAKVYRLSGNNVKRAGYAELPGGLKEVAVDETITLTTEFIDDKEQAMRIKIESASDRPLKRPRDNPPPKESTANEIDGSIVALDGRRLQMTLNVEGKPRKFAVTKDCSVLLAVKGSKKKIRYDVAPNGLADITVGLDVIVTVDSQSGKNVVTAVKIKNPPDKGDAKPGK